MPDNLAHIQAQSTYEEIDPSDEDAIYRVVDLAKRLQRKVIELEERIEILEEGG